MLCNRCGLTCDLPTGPVDHQTNEPHGLIEQAVVGSYSSTPGNGHGALDDMTAYKFSLCEFCLDWLFCQFKIPPEVFEVDLKGVRRSNEQWRPAATRVEEDSWRRFKKEFTEEYEKRNAARR